MKKRIVFILTNYMGGGVEQCFNKTVRALLQSKDNIQIYLYVINQFTKKEQLPADIQIIRTLRDLVALKKQHWDFICVNYSSDWKSSLASAMISRNYISWIHGNPLIMATARTAKLNFFLLKKSYFNVCICHEQEELLHDIYGFDQSKLLTIYNCVDLESINIKRKEHLDIGCKYILMAARFDFSSKDYPTLLEAYARLNEDLRREYKLVLLGDGPDEDAVRQIIRRLKLDAYVIMPGYDSNPFKWMENASLFMLISKTEGLSLVVLEAMACKTPILITRHHTGGQELSQNGNNCMTVDIGDVNGLTDAIFEMLTNTNQASKLVENASLFVEKFDYKYFARHICDFFSSL